MPQTQNRAARRSRARRAATGGLKITIGDRSWDLSPEAALEELSALDASSVRKATGLSLSRLVAGAQDDPDIDTIAVLIFLAERQAGDYRITFQEVLESIHYGDTVKLEEITPEDAAAQPEDDAPET